MANLLSIDFSQPVIANLTVMHCIIIAALVVALIIVVIAIAVTSKKKKNSKDETSEVIDDSRTRETNQIIENNQDVNESKFAKVAAPNVEQTPITPEPVGEEEPIDEEPVAVEETVEEPESEEVAEELVANEVIEEPVVEEEQPVEEVQEESTEETIEEPAPVEEPAEEPVEEAIEEPIKEEAIEEQVVESEPEKPAKEEKKEKMVEKKPAKTTKKEPVKAAPAKVEKKPAPEKSKVKMLPQGKIEVCNSSIGGFNYILRANNGQLLYESKSYNSKESTYDAIDKFKEAVEAGMFSVREDKFGNFRFVLKSPTSANIRYRGESFSTKANCESNVESVKRWAITDNIVDSTEEDFVAEFHPYDIPKDVLQNVKQGKGAKGKWELIQVDPDDKKSPFNFILYANNGQVLYQSNDYSTKQGCLSALDTFVNTVKDGYFIVDPDKAGRFKFVLRSNKKGSLAEYDGNNFDDKQTCQKNIESVYKFAILTPIEDI